MGITWQGCRPQMFTWQEWPIPSRSLLVIDTSADHARCSINLCLLLMPSGQAEGKKKKSEYHNVFDIPSSLNVVQGHFIVETTHKSRLICGRCKKFLTSLGHFRHWAINSTLKVGEAWRDGTLRPRTIITTWYEYQAVCLKAKKKNCRHLLDFLASQNAALSHFIMVWFGFFV